MAIILSALAVAVVNLVVLVKRISFSSPLSKGFYPKVLNCGVYLHTHKESPVSELFVPRTTFVTTG